ncbi:hypothetical protein AYI68_g4491 [Smittium mucronatum]|uniref:BHLH domain-containing protein n=1 Tax=Smittium mucronatum TaxID=133383 RepID=A0A1R0GX28_9FUNG|nr:hypothetical protein AYI68_g4491 [Smittium mucronatum]
MDQRIEHKILSPLGIGSSQHEISFDSLESQNPKQPENSQNVQFAFPDKTLDTFARNFDNLIFDSGDSQAFDIQTQNIILDHFMGGIDSNLNNQPLGADKTSSNTGFNFGIQPEQGFNRSSSQETLSNGLPSNDLDTPLGISQPNFRLEKSSFLVNGPQQPHPLVKPPIGGFSPQQSQLFLKPTLDYSFFSDVPNSAPLPRFNSNPSAAPHLTPFTYPSDSVFDQYCMTPSPANFNIVDDGFYTNSEFSAEITSKRTSSGPTLPTTLGPNGLGSSNKFDIIDADLDEFVYDPSYGTDPLRQKLYDPLNSQRFPQFINNNDPSFLDMKPMPNIQKKKRTRPFSLDLNLEHKNDPDRFSNPVNMTRSGSLYNPAFSFWDKTGQKIHSLKHHSFNPASFAQLELVNEPKQVDCFPQQSDNGKSSAGQALLSENSASKSGKVSQMVLGESSKTNMIRHKTDDLNPKPNKLGLGASHRVDRQLAETTLKPILFVRPKIESQKSKSASGSTSLVKKKKKRPLSDTLKNIFVENGTKQPEPESVESSKAKMKPSNSMIDISALREYKNQESLASIAEVETIENKSPGNEPALNDDQLDSTLNSKDEDKNESCEKEALLSPSDSQKGKKRGAVQSGTLWQRISEQRRRDAMRENFDILKRMLPENYAVSDDGRELARPVLLARCKLFFIKIASFIN